MRTPNKTIKSIFALGLFSLPLVGMAEGVDISGVIEVELVSAEDYAGAKLSDIALATVEIGLDSQINDSTDVHVLLLKEDHEDFDVDEAVITLTGPENSPGTIAAGRMYVPFGSFESNMISDPLTLEIGETREDAIQLGFEAGAISGSFYAFNGEEMEASQTDDDELQFGLNLGFSMENDDMAMDIGVDYISALNDSDSLEGLGGGTVVEHVAGLGVHLVYSNGPISFISEYVAAMDNYNVADVDFNGQGAEPSAYNIELGYNLELGGKPSTIAIGYQGTEDALALGLAETRTLVAFSMEIHEGTSFGIEYAMEDDYATSDVVTVPAAANGSGNDQNAITFQLAAEF